MWNHKSCCCVLVNQFLSRCSVSEVDILTRTIIGWENINNAHEPMFFLTFRFQSFFTNTSQFRFWKISAFDRLLDCCCKPWTAIDSFTRREHNASLVQTFYSPTYIENITFSSEQQLTRKVKSYTLTMRYNGRGRVSLFMDLNRIFETLAVWKLIFTYFGSWAVQTSKSVQQ